MNWVPSYVRREFRKQTSCTIDEKGNNISKKNIYSVYRILNEKQTR